MVLLKMSLLRGFNGNSGSRISGHSAAPTAGKKSAVVPVTAEVNFHGPPFSQQPHGTCLLKVVYENMFFRRSSRITLFDECIERL